MKNKLNVVTFNLKVESTGSFEVLITTYQTTQKPTVLMPSRQCVSIQPSTSTWQEPDSPPSWTAGPSALCLAVLPVRGAERTDCSPACPYNHENDSDCCLYLFTASGENCMSLGWMFLSLSSLYAYELMQLLCHNNVWTSCVSIKFVFTWFYCFVVFLAGGHWALDPPDRDKHVQMSRADAVLFRWLQSRWLTRRLTVV
jgi:hypothetical protein